MQTLVNLIHRAEDTLLIGALASMLLMALLQIVLRNFFDAGLLWAESFLRILVLWVAMLGAMVATRERNHINIDALSRLLTVKQRKVLGLVTGLFSAGICGLVAYHAVEFVRYEYEDETTAFGVVPTWICQAIIPFGLGVMAWRFLLQAITGPFERE